MVFITELKVSIVVPIYNIEDFVEECIQSIIKQTYKDIEIVLVNDGSSDSSAAITSLYAAKDSRVKLINKQNQGLIRARQDGLRAATGDYILYVDGDDWIEPEFVEVYVRQALASRADIVMSDHWEYLKGNKAILRNGIKPGYYNKNRLENEVYPFMLCSGKFSQFGIFSYVWGKLYKKSILLNHQLNVNPEIFIGEDAACLYPTLLEANSLSVIDQPLYNYRQRINSLIKTKKNDEISKIQLFYSYLYKIFKSHQLNTVLLPQLNLFTLSLLAVRSNGRTANNQNDLLYPFSRVRKGDNVVIYGAGTFGQHLKTRITNSESLELAGWVDDLAEFYSKLGIDVRPTKAITLIPFDKVVIAFIDEAISFKMSARLLQMGIPHEKICQVAHYKDLNTQLTLENYGIRVM